jgi:hypothetical protein
METRSGTLAEPGLRAPGLVQWRAVFAGAVVGLALFSLLSVLWLALGFNSRGGVVATHLSWFLGGAAIVSLFVGAYLTGWLSGLRGWTPGLVNGVTMWGLLVVIALGAGIPTVLAVLHIAPNVAGRAAGLWPTFWSVLIALVTAGFGGGLGGAAAPSMGLRVPRTAAPQAG